MMTTVSPITYPASKPRIKPPSNTGSIRFQGGADQFDPSAAANPTEPAAPSATTGSKLMGAVKQFGPMKRLMNGITNVINLFRPGQLGSTIKRMVIFTSVLTAMSSLLGPFALPMIPLYAGASLLWDTIPAFITGVWHKPNAAPNPAAEEA